MSRYGVWAPIPQRVGGTQKWVTGRYGRTPTAVVIHRMEGSLMGSDSYLRREFADYSPFPRLRASTHFGIGDWNGTPQIRQWVDTNNAAWGWNARPMKYGSLLKLAAGADFTNAGADLNWKVVAIEYAGFAHQAWNHRWTPKLKELLRAIRNAHGNLLILVHNDNSFKTCPGMAAFNVAFPGWHGNRLANVLGTVTVPNTSTSTTIHRADGVPANMRYRRRSLSMTLKAGKPVRNGASTRATTVARPSAATKVHVIGEMKQTGHYDPWFMYHYYLGNGDALCYSPRIDFA